MPEPDALAKLARERLRYRNLFLRAEGWAPSRLGRLHRTYRVVDSTERDVAGPFTIREVLNWHEGEYGTPGAQLLRRLEAGKGR
jgi:hypothetical protein